MQNALAPVFLPPPSIVRFLPYEDRDLRRVRSAFAPTAFGHYRPPPSMLRRKGDAWLPVYEALRLDWVDQATGGDRPYSIRPAATSARIAERLSGAWHDLF